MSVYSFMQNECRKRRNEISLSNIYRYRQDTDIQKKRANQPFRKKWEKNFLEDGTQMASMHAQN